MARIESQAKAGFYPTPDSVCELLKLKITCEDDARLLDPCCGKGISLSRLAPATTLTYGVELSHDRAVEARTRLHHVLWADALSEIRFTRQAFGLLYLNPPYDHSLTTEVKSQRLETLFLREYMKSLQLGGLLVFIIPYYILANDGCAKALSRNFKTQVLGFPEKEFQAFKQCIVFGRRQKIAADQAKYTEQRLRALGAMEPDVFLAEVFALEDMTPVRVPAANNPLKAFSTSRFDPATGIAAFHKAGIFRGVLEELAPKKKNFIRPLSMLENGHLALVLAGGFMNGEIEKDGRRLVVKGMVRKESPIVSTSCNEQGEGGSFTTRDKYIPTVKVIDMEKAKLFTVQ
jgi:Uncharacterised methyltransferase family (DUF6094)